MGKPTLLISSSEKAAYDCAVKEAQKASLKFISLSAKDFPKYEKHFYSNPLSGDKCLFYLSEAHALSYTDAQKFIEMIASSNNTFILSATAEVNWYLRKTCFVSQLSLIPNEITEQLRVLLTDVDRNFVRSKLEKCDPVHLFHILKFNVYLSPDNIDALLDINRYIYKSKSYLIKDMLSYAIKPKPYLLKQSKREEEPLQKSIKAKLSKTYSKLSSSDIADAYLLANSAHSSLGIELSDEEKAFLKIDEAKPVEEAVFVKTQNLSDYF